MEAGLCGERGAQNFATFWKKVPNKLGARRSASGLGFQ